MTTIYIKNRDFSGGKLANYTMPVEGATLSAWVGDDDPDFAFRNLASGADLTYTSAPTKSEDFWRDFSISAGKFLTSDVARVAGNMTLMAVMKKVVGVSTNGPALSTEQAVGVGRRGFTLYQPADLYKVAIQCSRYDLADTRIYASTDNASASAKCVFGTYTEDGTKNEVISYNMTESTVSTPNNSTNAAYQYDSATEAGVNFRIGGNYLVGASTAVNQIAYVAVWPRALTPTERATAYASVKRRATSFGVMI